MSSWMYKQQIMAEVIHRFQLSRVLTYMGCFGSPIMKGTHLLSNFSLKSCARKATKEVKKQHAKRVKKDNARLKALGLRVPVYWIRTARGFQGGPDLASTAVYPSKFVNAVFGCYLKDLAGTKWLSTNIPFNCECTAAIAAMSLTQSVAELDIRRVVWVCCLRRRKDFLIYIFFWFFLGVFSG